MYKLCISLICIITFTSETYTRWLHKTSMKFLKKNATTSCIATANYSKKIDTDENMDDFISQSEPIKRFTKHTNGSTTVITLNGEEITYYPDGSKITIYEDGSEEYEPPNN